MHAAIWLTINPSIENVNLPVRQWVMEASSGKTNKVPTAFIYGKEDTKGDNTALGYMREIVPGYVRGKPIKDNPVPLSGDKAVKTNLTGSKLLQKNLDTASWIVTDYLGNDDMQKTLKEEWRERDAAKSNCYWIFPGLVVVQAKNGMELYSLPLNQVRSAELIGWHFRLAASFCEHPSARRSSRLNETHPAFFSTGTASTASASGGLLLGRISPPGKDDLHHHRQHRDGHDRH